MHKAMRRSSIRALTIACVFISSELTAAAVLAQQVDGSEPLSAMVFGQDGALYGTAASGGPGDGGVVFRITLDGKYSILAPFGSSNTAAGSNYLEGGLLLAPNGNLIGIADQGGTNGTGSIYSVTPSGVVSQLFAFDAGDNPPSGVPYWMNLALGSDGLYYGAANLGGANGNGTLFNITPGGSFTVLHTFDSDDGQEKNTGGAIPEGGLVLGTDGSFYGVTAAGGVNGAGTFYQLKTNGDFAVLHSFDPSTEGFDPWDQLIQGEDGDFYGVTKAGVNGGGAVFKVTSQGQLTVLHAFSASDGHELNVDGVSPFGKLAFDASGNLYGTTSEGGSNGYGVIFRISTGGYFSVLHTFGTSPDAPATDGSSPDGGLIVGCDGNLYGTTMSGGSLDYGTIYRSTPSGVLTTLHNFGDVGSSSGGSSGGGSGVVCPASSSSGGSGSSSSGASSSSGGASSSDSSSSSSSGSSSGSSSSSSGGSTTSSSSSSSGAGNQGSGGGGGGAFNPVAAAVVGVFVAMRRRRNRAS